MRKGHSRWFPLWSWRNIPIVGAVLLLFFLLGLSQLFLSRVFEEPGVSPIHRRVLSSPDIVLDCPYAPPTPPRARPLPPPPINNKTYDLDLYAPSREPRVFDCVSLFGSTQKYKDDSKAILFGKKNENTAGERSIDSSRILCSIEPLKPLQRWSVILGIAPQWVSNALPRGFEEVSRYIQGAAPFDGGLFASNYPDMNWAVLHREDERCLMQAISSFLPVRNDTILSTISVQYSEDLYSPAQDIMNTLFGNITVPAMREMDLLVINTEARQCQTLDLVLKTVVPKLVVVSFNPLYPPYVEFSSDYNPDNENGEVSPLLSGCSLAAVSAVARAHGYELVHVDLWQAYYIRKEATHMLGNLAHDDDVLWHSGYFSQPIIQHLRTTKGPEKELFAQLWRPQVDEYERIKDPQELLNLIRSHVQKESKTLNVQPQVSLQITDLRRIDLRYRNRPNQQKLFLYLIQTSKLGRADRITSDRELITANSDRLAITYETAAEKEGYYHFPNSTWTTGRNKLFEMALEKEKMQGWKYLYWIFLDFDIELCVRQHRNAKLTSWIDPWRLFESYLLEYEPAVALPRYAQDEKITHQVLDSPPRFEVEARYHFDAIVNAFHREALDNLLPYDPRFDEVSWWYSQLIIIYKAYYLYHDHIHEFSRIFVNNPQHSGYPRKRDWENAVQQVLNLYPSQRGESCFLEILNAKGGGHGTIRPKQKAYDKYTYANASPCLVP